MADNYLVHYGIKGQKWYERRFQNPDGSLTAAGRIRYGVGQAVKKAVPRVRILVKKKANRTQTIQEELKAQTEKEKEEAKQKAIRSGNANQILKYQDQMSTQELNDALNRMRSVSALSDQVSKEAKTTADANKYNKVSHKLGRGIVKLADFTMNSVNTVQKFVDAGKKAAKWFDDEDKSDFSKMTLDEAIDAAGKGKIKAGDWPKLFSAISAQDKVFAARGEKKPSKSAETKTESIEPQSTSSDAKTESKPAFTQSNNRSSLSGAANYYRDKSHDEKEARKDEAAANIKSFWNSRSIDDYASDGRKYSGDIKPVWNTSIDSSEYEKPNWFDELLKL